MSWPRALGTVVATLSGAAILALSTGSASLGSSHDRSEFNRAAVRSYLDETPGVPLVLPRTLPASYRWLGPDAAQLNWRGWVVVRSSVFVPGPIGSGPIVTVCIEASDPSQCPRETNEVIRADGSGARVVILFSGVEPTRQDLEWWDSVELGDPFDASWLG